MSWQKNYQTWLNFPALVPELQTTLKAMSQEQLEDAFSEPLSFGTAGMRGLMGPGINRMNTYTVRQATEGLAQFILQSGSQAKDKGVVIAYDSRHHSSDFAMEAALVLGKSGIKVYVYESLRPTPVLSFAVRFLKACAGIMITASHNPADYNGYKLYGPDGGQLAPEDAETITQFIRQVEDPLTVEIGDKTQLLGSGLVEIIGDRVDQAYLERMKTVTVNPDLVHSLANQINLVYTPLHGTGRYLACKALAQVGFNQVHVVQSQAEPNGDFPTLTSPNPEVAEAYTLAEELGRKVGADILLATDPDADRLGAMVRVQDGSYQLLTGNQLACLMVDYLLNALKSQDALPKNGVVVKSLVSTDLVNSIMSAYGLETIEVLTGFKFIAQKIAEYEQTGEASFLFGFEESYGYLRQPFARDKDAIQALLLMAELTAYHKGQGRDLSQALNNLFQKYGYFYEKTLSKTFTGVRGKRQMQVIMEELRENPPKEMGGIEVAYIADYQLGHIWDRQAMDRPTNLPKTNTLKLTLTEGSWVAFRPSGTEPKLKIYLGTKGESESEVLAKAEKIEAHILAIS